MKKFNKWKLKQTKGWMQVCEERVWVQGWRLKWKRKAEGETGIQEGGNQCSNPHKLLVNEKWSEQGEARRGAALPR